LVGIEYLGLMLRRGQRALECLDAKRTVQCVGKTPRKNVTAIPVNDCREVHKTLLHGDVSDDIYFQMTARPNVTKNVKLSKQIGAQEAAAVAARIRDIKGFSGGRFYVNEFKTIFTPLNEYGEMRYVYIGQLDLAQWFGPPGSESAT
jgi:hypothetical protein